MLPAKHQAMPSHLCSGWLSKSPPEKKMRRRLKLLRSKWKMRFFVLQQTKEEYELSYYKNEQSNTKKGSINLERCNEVIESIHSDFFPNLLALKTWHKNKTRMYYLAASSQAEMKDWVHWLCFVCGINTPPQETHVLELNPTLDYLSLGQSAVYPVDFRSGDISVRPRSCSRVFSRTPDDINLSAVQQESVTEEESKQDGDTPLAADDTPFQCFIKQLSESLSCDEPEFDGTEQFHHVTQGPPAIGTVTQEQPVNGTVTQEPPANGTVSQEPPANGTVSQELPANGTVSQEPPANGTVSQEPPANGTVSQELPANGTPEVFLRASMYNTGLSQSTLQAQADAMVASFEEDNVSTGSSYLLENGEDVPDFLTTPVPSQPKMHHMSTGYDVPTSSSSKCNKASNKTALPIFHRT